MKHLISIIVAPLLAGALLVESQIVIHQGRELQTMTRSLQKSSALLQSANEELESADASMRSARQAILVQENALDECMRVVDPSWKHSTDTNVGNITGMSTEPNP